MSNPNLLRLRDQITTKVFAHWWYHEMAGTRIAAPHLNLATAATWRVQGRLVERLLPPTINLGGPGDWLKGMQQVFREAGTDLTCQQWLTASLQYTEVRENVVSAVGGLRVAAFLILGSLTESLRNSNEDVRNAATRIGVSLGIATPEIFSALVLLLRNPNLAVQWKVAEALLRMGPAAGTPEVLDVLIEKLSDVNPYLRDAAANALASLGSAATTPEVLAALIRLLSDTDLMVFDMAGRALGRLGPTAATPEVLAALIRSLSNPRYSTLLGHPVVHAVEGLGAAAATREFLAALVEFLRSADRRVQSAAVQVVRALGSAACTHDFLTALIQMLGAADPSVRWAAAMASGRLGKAALLRISTTLGRLCDGDNEQEVRLAAILASIGLIADVDAPETLATLAKWIVIPNMHVRVAALQAVARLRTAPSAELVAALVQAIRDCDENLQCLAAEVAGILGVAATPNILAALGPMIRHRSELVQAAALSAVSSIGAAAPPDILVALVKLFVHPRTTGSMRLGIADALCVLGREGVRLFIRHRWFRHPKVVLRTTKELAGEEILAPSPGFSQPPS